MGLLLIFRIGLLVLLWLFILVIVRTLRKDLGQAAGPASKPTFKIKGQPRLLAIVDGPMTGSHLDISALQDLTIGRSSDADFTVGDDYASGRHARLFRRGGDWFVEDLASRNGTYLAGMRIDQPEKVQVGSDIKIGRTTVRLEP